MLSSPVMHFTFSSINHTGNKETVPEVDLASQALNQEKCSPSLPSSPSILSSHENKSWGTNGIKVGRSYNLFNISKGVLVPFVAGKRRRWTHGHLHSRSLKDAVAMTARDVAMSEFIMLSHVPNKESTSLMTPFADSIAYVARKAGEERACVV